MTTTPDLWPIGNCQVSALIDRAGRLSLACVPRVDCDPAFSSLLNGQSRRDEGGHGLWEIDLEGTATALQHDLRNTPFW